MLAGLREGAEAIAGECATCEDMVARRVIAADFLQPKHRSGHPKIIYLYYLKNMFSGSMYPKNKHYEILKAETLLASRKPGAWAGT